MDASIVSEIQRALFSINNPIESNGVRKEAYLQLESFKENATDDLLIYAFETIIHQSVPCMLSTCAHNHEPATLSIPSSNSTQIALSHVMFGINLIEDAFLRRHQPTVGTGNSSSDQPSLISPTQNRIISTGNSTKIMQIVLWLCQQAEQSPCSQERALPQTPLSAATSNNQAKCATCSYLKLVAVKLGIIVGGLLEQVFLGIGASAHQDLLLFFKSGIHARFILLEGISSLMDVLSGTTYRRNVQPIIELIFCNVSFILDLLFAGARGEGRALDMNLATQTCLDGWSRQTQISAYQGIAKLSTNTNSFLTLLQRDVLELAVYPLRTQITNRDGFGSLDGELNAACIAILANISGVGSPSSEIGPSKFTSEMDDGYRLFIEKVVVLCLEYPGFIDSKHAAALAEVLVQLGCVHIPRCILAEQEALRVMSESGFRLLENYILIMLRLFLHDNPDLSLLSLDFWARWFAIVHADHLKRCPESKTSELEQNDEKLIQLRQRKRQLNIQIVELFVPAALRKLILITLKDRMVKEQVAGYSFIVDFEDSTDPETDTEFDGIYWIQGTRSGIQHSLQLAVSYCQREPDNLTSTINVLCSWAVEYALDRLFELICQVNKSVQEGLTMVDWDETRMITRLNELPDTQSTLWKFGELYGGLQATSCQSFARSALYVALRATSLFTCFVTQAFSVSQESKCSGGCDDSDQLF